VQKIPVAKIRPNRLQPRREFPSESLQALAASIKGHGLAQPIVVCPDDSGDLFELVAGERRLRAAQLAGLTEIEAVVRPPLSDPERLCLALIENLQREDLNPIDLAHGFRRLIEEFGLSQAALAEAVGRSRPAVANTLRLLELDSEIQASIRSGQISEGHGRALLTAIPSRRKPLWQRAIREGWSVRRLEAAACRQPRAPGPPEAPPEVRALRESLQQLLGTKVDLVADAKGRGSIRIHFYSLEDFDRLMSFFKKASLKNSN